MTSLSIVDVRERRFVTEVQTPGCSLVYTAGPRRFFMLCANGGALVVTVDDEGREQSVVRTPPFFDPNNDPVTEKAVRRGNEWLSGRSRGKIHPVDVSGSELRFGDKWSLVDDADLCGAVARRRRAAPRGARRLGPPLRPHAPGREGHPQEPGRRCGSTTWPRASACSASPP
jgi:hypothetical protein